MSDSGEGIEPESLGRVFDRFQQGEEARANGGLGLGLAIARHIVEAHHGSVVARSGGRGRGATFIARFPMERVPPTPIAPTDRRSESRAIS